MVTTTKLNIILFLILFMSGIPKPGAWGNLDELGNSDLQYHSGWNDFNTFSQKRL